ncbi:hypothetical protein MFUM_110002 [Methylacidiphilum fumariolicum SolV]|uniref:Uncharacterized protein n=2 Tax=Candidatus Methylacidiphilum fumarolicum TaxID=591154 RepID=I0JW89_METFB|nr:conserved protein of unknown function [Candidatus Methylacidiphilum fumarolicum]CCG91508.1 hypothetical protein MFUM_110002 [Methylacidiphilum fumariolicum SolV]
MGQPPRVKKARAILYDEAMYRTFEEKGRGVYRPYGTGAWEKDGPSPSREAEDSRNNLAGVRGKEGGHSLCSATKSSEAGREGSSQG